MNPKARSYPWRCTDCGKDAVNPVLVDRTVQIKYEGALQSVRVPQLPISRCENCDAVLEDTRTEEAIHLALRKQLGLLSPAEIRTAREELGLTQEQLAERNSFAAESLSRWETGSVIQSRAYDKLLRLYFGSPKVRDFVTQSALDDSLGRVVVTGNMAAWFAAWKQFDFAASDRSTGFQWRPDHNATLEDLLLCEPPTDSLPIWAAGSLDLRLQGLGVDRGTDQVPPPLRSNEGGGIRPQTALPMAAEFSMAA